MKNFIVIFLSVFFLSGCVSKLNLGMNYQKVLLARKGNVNVYCYCLAWAVDAEAYFISSNENVCLGFNSKKDYCFGKGYQVIYYKFENDTLRLYTYGSIPTIPQSVSMPLSLTNLDKPSLDEYEMKFKAKKIEKIVLDSFSKVPCKLSGISIDLLNVKFE